MAEAVALRDYQKRTISSLMEWFASNPTGNPCIVLPTGAGKSHIVAALCKDALQNWPETRILMLTHVKELIEQNAEKMRAHWPGAPLGIYSAGIGKKQLGEPITFAGIQSIAKRAKDLGKIDLVIIDEAHLASHKAEGGYRDFLAVLAKSNPAMRIIGLTATPYRLGHGSITDAPALFHALIEPVSIEQLVAKGHLAPLRSKVTSEKLSVEGVHRRGGEFIESELQRAVDKADKNAAVVREVIALAGERRSWLFFCCGVEHAQHVCDALTAQGIASACITGETPKAERERVLAAFKRGEIRALTNANVLTTGFDAPNIDLIAMMRPTLSPGLYVQMAGRGFRPKAHVADCLVLDFAGVVATHGPITNVRPPRKAGSGSGEAPVKVCPTCGELCATSARECSACGELFPEPKDATLALHDDDIMGDDRSSLVVLQWRWMKHLSQSSGKEMLRVRYYGELGEMPLDEYFCIQHDGYAGEKARRELARIASQAGLTPGWDISGDLTDLAMRFNEHDNVPNLVKYKMEGKFPRITSRIWSE